jgi:hypothetical protein
VESNSYITKNNPLANTTNADVSELLHRLQRPKNPVDVILDTDTYNEIDDQYALAYLIKKSEKLNLKAIYAAPFYNTRSSSPADGMERSYKEILNVLTLLGRDDLKPIVHRGSTNYLPDEYTPIESEAAHHLASLALDYSSENPLYIIAIGAITNIASAILLQPEIREHIVIIWIGGNAFHWHDNREFNLSQDIAAARIVLGCGTAVILLPAMGVVSAFTTSEPELYRWLYGKNALCDYLYRVTVEEARAHSHITTWTRAIWDVTAVAWLLNDEFMLDCIKNSPIPEYDGRWGYDQRRSFIKYVYYINRDKLFEDLVTTLVTK